MKQIQNIGLALFLVGLAIFTSLIFFGRYEVTPEILENLVSNKGIKSELFINNMNSQVVGKEFSNPFSFSTEITSVLESANETLKKNSEWDKVIWDKPHSLTYEIAKQGGSGLIKDNKWLFWWLTFGLGIIGALMHIIPNVVIKGPPGIKNNGIWFNTATNRGWIGWFAFVFLVGFYLLLYFRPDYIVNWTYIVDPISESLSGNLASQWFLYGFLYCTVMTVMAVRMYIKYRHNKYQILRTTSVLFFQIVFAFLIPEILIRFEKPWYDFKNAFPLDYDFFFKWNLDELIASGGLGLFILIWGIVLTLVIVPVMVYFFGKRWYCSWVCGCGGLAETLGDPYRHLSDKSLKAWKLERWLVHGVLVFALVMTGFTLYTYFSGAEGVLGIRTQTIQDIYGLLIGAFFAGVIGTGFYPIFGNRVWCRFGCPLAAYLGIVQRFKSRFRITTNGGQCISCGNCSTYCEQGIDVRAYAQKGENIVRASCVGCGICSAVCPRGVLKLENGPEKGRINPTEILLGNDVDLMDLVNQK
ncbi:4Fe-4S binding protein [Flavobacteriaceae bacterium S0825]|uniref:4Fe-4S binding protein n=1 Tax=Gaetbulibacter sp. S0825 TaxID=2720084 RepID=UPI001431D6A2|nr:4Fe-4S dicluster domain-containing protein [Gaetbulibacter sp. S0825]MCK0107778.1 4Fe-4S binding protein [Flavobacteriaceae bacterium S0825]NIX63414.1 4Fe-4S binding protein [Gaetbulibacter sp. S0825]